MNILKVAYIKHLKTNINYTLKRLYCKTYTQYGSRNIFTHNQIKTITSKTEQSSSKRTDSKSYFFTFFFGVPLISVLCLRYSSTCYQYMYNKHRKLLYYIEQSIPIDWSIRHNDSINIKLKEIELNKYKDNANDIVNMLNQNPNEQVDSTVNSILNEDELSSIIKNDILSNDDEDEFIQTFGFDDSTLLNNNNNKTSINNNKVSINVNNHNNTKTSINDDNKTNKDQLNGKIILTEKQLKVMFNQLTYEYLDILHFSTMIYVDLAKQARHIFKSNLNNSLNTMKDALSMNQKKILNTKINEYQQNLESKFTCYLNDLHTEFEHLKDEEISMNNQLFTEYLIAFTATCKKNYLLKTKNILLSQTKDKTLDILFNQEIDSYEEWNRIIDIVLNKSYQQQEEMKLLLDSNNCKYKLMNTSLTMLLSNEACKDQSNPSFYQLYIDYINIFPTLLSLSFIPFTLNSTTTCKHYILNSLSILFSKLLSSFYIYKDDESNTFSLYNKNIINKNDHIYVLYQIKTCLETGQYEKAFLLSQSPLLNEPIQLQLDTWKKQLEKRIKSDQILLNKIQYEINHN